MESRLHRTCAAIIVIYWIGLVLPAAAAAAATGGSHKPKVVSGRLISVTVRYLPGLLAHEPRDCHCGRQAAIALGKLPPAHYGPREATHLEKRLNHLRRVGRGEIACPIDFGNRYRLRFTHHSGLVSLVSVDASGCEFATNARAPGRARWATSALLSRLHSLLVDHRNWRFQSNR